MSSSDVPTESLPCLPCDNCTCTPEPTAYTVSDTAAEVEDKAWPPRAFETKAL